jgi:aminoglycoside phosphotransferase family enzyme
MNFKSIKLNEIFKRANSLDEMRKTKQDTEEKFDKEIGILERKNSSKKLIHTHKLLKASPIVTWSNRRQTRSTRRQGR